jgi:hypothetical protein
MTLDCDRLRARSIGIFFSAVDGPNAKVKTQIVSDDLGDSVVRDIRSRNVRVRPAGARPDDGR